MNKSSTWICAPAFAVLIMAHPAWAQSAGEGAGGAGTGSAAGQGTTTATPSGAARASQLSRADRGFLEQAAQNGHAEVESSKLALEKAQDPQVKSFAQHMVQDHTKANGELASLASSKGLEVPKEPSLLQKAKMKLLEAADGEDFDRRYVETMGVEAHEDTIDLFRKGAKEARDQDVKAFASKTLPKLEEHLKMARDLKRMTDAGASASGTGSATGTSGTGTPQR